MPVLKSSHRSTQQALAARPGEGGGGVRAALLCPMQRAEELGLGADRIEPGVLHHDPRTVESAVDDLTQELERELACLHSREIAGAEEHPLGIMKARVE